MTPPVDTQNSRRRPEIRIVRRAAPTAQFDWHAQLLERLETREATIGVIGLGYVGLPLQLAFAEQNFLTLGFDVDLEKVAAIEDRYSYLPHIASDRLEDVDVHLDATADFARLGEPDVLLICVPTPLTPQRDPDLRYVRQTAEQIALNLRPGQLVVLESTTWPGTTEEVVQPILQRSGLDIGEHYFLAFSPEREDPGNKFFDTRSIPKVVGGVGRKSTEVASMAYRQIVPDVVEVSSTRAAEATKLTENIFRAVNIALVNELKMIYQDMDIDVREVLDAAETKPFGFMRFDPGPGWGGHCIPVDPFYLAWKARESGNSARFVELAGVINVEMPKYVIGKLRDGLDDMGKPLRGSKIMLLGLAYKKNVGDPRESPAFELLDLLLARGADVSYHDPHVPMAPEMRSWPDLPVMESVALDPKSLAEQDAVVVVTAHDEIEWPMVLEHAPLIIDSRGVYREANDNVIRA